MRTRRYGNRIKAFTLTELLMACFVISVALLGVYSLFQQAMGVEAKMTSGMYHQRRADQVADYFADALERCINLKDLETIRAGVSEQGGFLEYTAVGKGFSSDAADARGLARQRIAWQRTQDRGGYVVTRQTMRYAGLKNVTFQDESQADWNALPAAELFEQIDVLEIDFQETGKPSGSWQKDYKGSVGQVAIRIKAASGDRAAQRIVVPAANGVLE